LWIAFKLCIFDYLKQSLYFRWTLSKVVNCFQTLYLWLSETMECTNEEKEQWLWIAFKLCIFDYLKQSTRQDIYMFKSCELLSNFVSLTIWNNLQQNQFLCRSCELLSNFVSLTIWNNNTFPSSSVKSVVNCFQTLYLWLSETINKKSFITLLTLWIAFKLCIFDYLKQY